MIALLQRVSRANVRVAERTVAAIGPGLLVLVGIERGDDEAEARRLAERLLAYRVFADEAGRMNRSVVDVRGALLIVPQFTLAADTGKGNRPSFSRAAEPVLGERLFGLLADVVELSGIECRRGCFGAHMAVESVNDGPVTFWLRTASSAD